MPQLMRVQTRNAYSGGRGGERCPLDALGTQRGALGHGEHKLVR